MGSGSEAGRAAAFHPALDNLGTLVGISPRSSHTRSCVPAYSARGRRGLNYQAAYALLPPAMAQSYSRFVCAYWPFAPPVTM